jgi:ribosomal protein S27AE
MTDLSTDLGGTRTCPACGEQVSVPQDHGRAVPCPKCGAAVPPGPPPYEEDGELTVDEAMRTVAVAGYDTEMEQVGGGEARCERCGATVAVDRIVVRSLRRATDVVGGGRTVTVAAVRCPNCDALARMDLAHDVDDDRAVLVAMGVDPDEA